MLGRMGDDQHDSHELPTDDSTAEATNFSEPRTADAATPLERGTDIALRLMMRRR